MLIVGCVLRPVDLAADKRPDLYNNIVCYDGDSMLLNVEYIF